MTDPRKVLGQARQGPVPVSWRVFTPEGAIEYASERKPLTMVSFNDLAAIALQVHGQSFSDSTLVTLQVWIDLHYRDGRTTKWRSTSFADNLQTTQCFIEAYGAHKARRGRRAGGPER